MRPQSALLACRCERRTDALRRRPLHELRDSVAPGTISDHRALDVLQSECSWLIREGRSMSALCTDMCAQANVSSALFVNLLVNDEPVMSRRFGERVVCKPLESNGEVHEKCITQGVQAAFFYQAEFSGPVSIAFGTSFVMGAHTPLLTHEKFTHLTITRFGPALQLNERPLEKAPWCARCSRKFPQCDSSGNCHLHLPNRLIVLSCTCTVEGRVLFHHSGCLPSWAPSHISRKSSSHALYVNNVTRIVNVLQLSNSAPLNLSHNSLIYTSIFVTVFNCIV